MMQKVVIGSATLYQGDCMDLMATLSDKTFDLAIVDPPYGINVNHNMGRRKGNKASEYKPAVWDSHPPKKEYFDELQRISKNQIIWGANHFIDHVAKRSPCWIVWDKLFSQDVSFAAAELAWTSFDSVTKKFTLSPADATRIHPTQKPVKLYEWILTNYAKQSQTILDTHLGSGSSAIAANKLGFEFTGIELDKDYFNAACDRIEKALSQTDMFAPIVESKPEQHGMFDEAA